MVGNCRARASPAEMIALLNIGGPLNRFIIMTDICASMGKSELYSRWVWSSWSTQGVLHSASAMWQGHVKA